MHSDTASMLVDTVYTVLGLIRVACREPCARPLCEDLEDVIMMLLDEAGDTEHVGLAAAYAAEQASRVLREASQKASARGCSRVAVLFEQAAELLAVLT